MRVLVRCGVAVVLVGAGLGAVWADPAQAAATATVGTTELGVGAFAGTDDVADYHKVKDHDGNATVTGSDSDTGPDGSASASATISSTASTTAVTVSGTANTSHGADSSVLLYPAVVYLDTVLGESGYWAYEGSVATTASNKTEHDACIPVSVRVAVYAPGEDVEDYNFHAEVPSCTNGSGHQEFGDIDAAGLPLAAGTRLEITGSFSTPGAFGAGTSSASFSLEVRKRPGTPPVPVTGTGAPVVTGTGVVGTVLSAGTGTWTGDPDTFAYRWRSGGVDVPGATGSTYTVRAADVGRQIVCRVTASKGASSATQDSQGILGRAAPSDPPTTGPTPLPPPPVALANTQPPTVSGTYRVGKTLTANAGQWAQPPASTTFQWLRNGAPIGGATSERYKLTKKDKGKKVSVSVTARSPGYLDATSTSVAKKVKAKPKKR